MYHHLSLGTTPYRRARRLHDLLAQGNITLAGNTRLRIYGTLGCGSGKRMNPKHRVFFLDEKEAQALGYRPCGHCQRMAYQAWKRNAYLATG
jgi:methylphosphotriester-DNA--protein-cysteine methyltransferase